MKATISELWNTGIDILLIDNDEFDSIMSVSDLSECDNVHIVKSTKQSAEILLDGQPFYVSFRQVSHPTGFGKLYVCEVY